MSTKEVAMNPLRERYSRRDFLATAGAGFGATALSALLQAEVHADIHRQNTLIDANNPLGVRTAHIPARAKNVIFLFQYGGPSQVDTFDYKPILAELNGKATPASIRAIKDKVTGVTTLDRVMAPRAKFAQHGQSGLWVSDLFPHVAEHADELCVIRSMTSESSNHAPATYQMNTGAILGGKPSMGSWLTYGLGSENQNLPGYVLLFKVAGLGGTANWSNAFLPAAFQGTRFSYEGTPVLNLQPPEARALSQRATLDMIQSLNRTHAAARPGLGDLEGRIAAYELAYRMQAEAMQVGDLSQESKATLDMYGVNDANKDLDMYARQCLLARRLVERGVRVVQTYHAIDKFGWDGHTNNADNHRTQAAYTDKPIAALLTDLKQRGLLDSTLVIWGGEFGRTPTEQGGAGRNHNPFGFTVWLAGGGVKGGQTIGTTDEIGLRAQEDPHPVKDLHATILHGLGLRHDDLFFEHNGRPERLTGVAGSAKVIERVYA
jgi:hypothetical protein